MCDKLATVLSPRDRAAPTPVVAPPAAPRVRGLKPRGLDRLVSYRKILSQHRAPGHDSLIQAATTSRTSRSELAIWFAARRRGNVNRLFPSWGGCFVSAGADIANDLLTNL